MTARFFQPWAQERIDEFRRADAFDSAVDWEHFVSLEFCHHQAAEIAVKIALSREVDTMYVGVCRTPTERFHGEEPWKHHWSYNKMSVLNAGQLHCRRSKIPMHATKSRTRIGQVVLGSGLLASTLCTAS